MLTHRSMIISSYSLVYMLNEKNLSHHALMGEITKCKYHCNRCLCRPRDSMTQGQMTVSLQVLMQLLMYCSTPVVAYATSSQREVTPLHNLYKGRSWMYCAYMLPIYFEILAAALRRVSACDGLYIALSNRRLNLDFNCSKPQIISMKYKKAQRRAAAGWSRNKSHSVIQYWDTRCPNWIYLILMGLVEKTH